MIWSLLPVFAMEIGRPASLGSLGDVRDVGEVLSADGRLIVLTRYGSPAHRVYTPTETLGNAIPLKGFERPKGFHWVVANSAGLWTVTKDGVLRHQALEGDQLAPAVVVAGRVPVTSTSCQLTVRGAELLIDKGRSFEVVSLDLAGVKSLRTVEHPDWTGEGRMPFVVDGILFFRDRGTGPTGWTLKQTPWPASSSPGRARTVTIGGKGWRERFWTVGTRDAGFDPKRPDRKRGEGACSGTMGHCRTDDVRWAVSWKSAVLLVNRAGEVLTAPVVH